MRANNANGKKTAGPQTHVHGNLHGALLSGQFDAQVDVHIHPPGEPRPIPMQKPSRAAHFTGRENELAELLAELRPGHVVTRCGPGGIGKSALVAEAVWTLAPDNHPPALFPDGIIFHTFYHQPDAALAMEAIARAFGEDPRPSPEAAARRALAGRRALVILDGAEAAADLNAVVEVAGGCGVVVTSRRHSDAPTHWKDVPPLGLDEAVRLLHAWGGDWAAHEVVARRVCELVGGLPLAVFLAGRYMGQTCQRASEYLDWLLTTPLEALSFGERQYQSVPLLMQRSVEQLSQTARGALVVAGVMSVAPFESAPVVAALGATAAAVGRALGELVNHGIMLRSGKSYEVSHALVHTYAMERLPPSREVLSRLAAHYNAYARTQSDLGLPGFRRLDAQRAHILAVQSACAVREEWGAVRDTTRSVRAYLDLQGYQTEHMATITLGLSAARVTKNRHEEGVLLNSAGLAYVDLGQPEKAIESCSQALAVCREIGDRRGEGSALCNIGLARADLGQYAVAIELFGQYLAIARELGDKRMEATALANMGCTYADLGQHRKSIEFSERAVAIHRATGRRGAEGIALANIGRVHLDLDQPQKAIECFEMYLTLARETGDRRSESRALGYMGEAYYCLRQPAKAIVFYEQYLALARGIGDRHEEGSALCNIGMAYAAMSESREAVESYQHALVLAREIGDRRGEATVCWHMGRLYEALGDLHQAVELMQRIVDFKYEIGHPGAEKDAASVAALRQRLADGGHRRKGKPRTGKAGK